LLPADAWTLPGKIRDLAVTRLDPWPAALSLAARVGNLVEKKHFIVRPTDKCVKRFREAVVMW